MAYVKDVSVDKNQDITALTMSYCNGQQPNILTAL